MKKNKEIIKRIIVEMGLNAHKEIKMRAANNNVSIKVWVSQAIAEKIAWEKKAE